VPLLLLLLLYEAKTREGQGEGSQEGGQRNQGGTKG